MKEISGFLEMLYLCLALGSVGFFGGEVWVLLKRKKKYGSIIWFALMIQYLLYINMEVPTRFKPKHALVGIVAPLVAFPFGQKYQLLVTKETEE